VKQGSMLNGSIYKKMEKALIGIKSVSESYWPYPFHKRVRIAATYKEVDLLGIHFCLKFFISKAKQQVCTCKPMVMSRTLLNTA
jgi:hypothetical protein